MRNQTTSAGPYRYTRHGRASTAFLLHPRRRALIVVRGSVAGHRHLIRRRLENVLARACDARGREQAAARARAAGWASAVGGAHGGGGRTAKEHIQPVLVREPFALGVALPLTALGRREERACASAAKEARRGRETFGDGRRSVARPAPSLLKMTSRQLFQFHRVSLSHLNSEWIVLVPLGTARQTRDSSAGERGDGRARGHACAAERALRRAYLRALYPHPRQCTPCAPHPWGIASAWRAAYSRGVSSQLTA